MANVEGGIKFGAVGDGGTSFGPFQLHIGGASPFSDPRRASAHANSRAGIAYALDRMGSAKGLRGRDAVAAIVRDFERPAAPGAEIERAMSHYGQLGSGSVAKGGVAGIRGMRAPAGAGQAMATSGNGSDQMRQLLAGYLLQSAQNSIQGKQQDSSGLLGLAMARSQLRAADQQFGPYAQLSARRTKGQTASSQSGPQHGVAGFPGGAQAMRQSIAEARRLGLRVSENPLVDHVDPVHVKGSYHYQSFGNSGVGRATDISGSPDAMAAFFKWARSRYGKNLTELFYDPLGGIKNGNPIGAIGGHRDHVHIAF